METVSKSKFNTRSRVKENIERLNKTVSNCLSQMQDTDRLIIVCKDSAEVKDALVKKWKNKTAVTLCSADTVQNAYNKIISETESEFTVFVHEGDRLGEGFLKNACAVMNGEIQQQLPFYEKEQEDCEDNDNERDDESDRRQIKAQIEDPQKIQVLFADNYWDDPMLSDKIKRFVLSRVSVLGTYTINIDDSYWALQTALNGAVLRSEFIKTYDFKNEICFEYETDVLLRMLLDSRNYMVSDCLKYYYYEPKERQELYHIPAHYKEWYFDSIEKYLLPLLEYEKDDSAFLQNYVVYYVLCRFLCNLDNRNKKQISEDTLDRVFF